MVFRSRRLYVTTYPFPICSMKLAIASARAAIIFSADERVLRIRDVPSSPRRTTSRRMVGTRNFWPTVFREKKRFVMVGPGLFGSPRRSRSDAR